MEYDYFQYYGDHGLYQIRDTSLETNDTIHYKLLMVIEGSEVVRAVLVVN